MGTGSKSTEGYGPQPCPAGWKRIFIVDDEEDVCSVLVMLLEAVNKFWKARKFTSPLEALKAVKEDPPHMVISDFRMEEMSGTALLEQVRQIAPHTVRIIISGYVPDTNNICAAHQLIAKPFTPDEFATVVKGAIAAQETLGSRPELARVVAGLTSFPVIPKIYYKVMRLLETWDYSVDDLCELLEQDAGVCTRLMHLARSPVFDGGSNVASMAGAVQCLGAQNIKGVVLSLHLFDTYSKFDFPELSVPELWKHSWETAQLAKQFCAQAGKARHGDNALLAGLLHDLGKLVFMENLTSQYRKICDEAIASHRLLAEVEKEQIGISSGEVSSLLMQLWGMPAEVVDAVALHHAPWLKPHTEFNTADALYMANGLARMTHPPDRMKTEELNRDYLGLVGAPMENLDVAPKLP